MAFRVGVKCCQYGAPGLSRTSVGVEEECMNVVTYSAAISACESMSQKSCIRVEPWGERDLEVDTPGAIDRKAMLTADSESRTGLDSAPGSTLLGSVPESDVAGGPTEGDPVCDECLTLFSCAPEEAEAKSHCSSDAISSEPYSNAWPDLPDSFVTGSSLQRIAQASRSCLRGVVEILGCVEVGKGNGNGPLNACVNGNASAVLGSEPANLLHGEDGMLSTLDTCDGKKCTEDTVSLASRCSIGESVDHSDGEHECERSGVSAALPPPSVVNGENRDSGVSIGNSQPCPRGEEVNPLEDRKSVV